MNSAEENTIVCRCEDLTLADVKKLLAEGITDMEEMKRISRCGMGPCQGRTCGRLVRQLIAAARGIETAKVSLTSFRPPLTPVKLECYVSGSDEKYV